MSVRHVGMSCLSSNVSKADMTDADTEENAMLKILFLAGLWVAAVILGPASYASPDLDQGEALFERHCAACHGENGDGKGDAERYLLPKARDFTVGVFKFRSTPSGSPPTDEDLYRTVNNGIAGTSMPSFARLSRQELESVVAYVKSFSDIFDDEDLVEPPIEIATPPKSTPRSIAAGAVIYKEMKCTKCHGETGIGDGPSSDNLTNDWEQPIRPYDLTRGSVMMKGGATSHAIYRTFMTGLDGTPMPSYVDDLTSDEGWSLVHYIQSLSNVDSVDESVLIKTPRTLVAMNGSQNVSQDVNDALWNQVQAVTVLLRPIQARDNWPDQVQVKILKSPTEIAFRFEWRDAAPNDKLTSATDFLDSIALQYAPEGMPQDYIGIPFFGMGDKSEKVHIWHWQPAALRSRNSQVVSVLEAYGFGTLEDQPAEAQTVLGAGSWTAGKWVVVMRQPLQAGSTFATQGSIAIAIAAWNGSEHDRAGQKSVSEWIELKLD